MFLFMGVKMASMFLKGYVPLSENSDLYVTILDTEDMTLEVYSLWQFTLLRRKVNVRYAYVFDGDDKWFSQNGMTVTKTYFSKCLHDKITCDAKSRYMVEDKLRFNNSVLMRSEFFERKSGWNILSVYIREEILFTQEIKDTFIDAGFQLLFGQNLGSNLYRVLISVRGECFPKEQRYVICAIFTETEFKGIEYVLDSACDDIGFNPKFEVDKPLKARLRLYSGG